MTVCEYRPGLEGVPATQSSISYVDGKEGILEYRGIPHRGIWPKEALFWKRPTC
jgi:citrate synthase